MTCQSVSLGIQPVTFICLWKRWRLCKDFHWVHKCFFIAQLPNPVEKKADKFQTSLWTRLVPLISKWSLKVLHREISNRFNVAPHLTFLDFQSYIIISTMSTIYEVIYSQNWSLIICQWFFWSQYSSLSCKVLPQHRNQLTVSVTKINCVLWKEG